MYINGIECFARSILILANEYFASTNAYSAFSRKLLSFQK